MNNSVLPEECLFRDEPQITPLGSILNPLPYFEIANFPKYMLQKLSQFGFVTPTPIQSQSWPVVFGGCNMVGISQTGSGKTLAYILPAILYCNQRGAEQIFENSIPSPIVLILAPTRELVQQIHCVATNFGSPHVRNVVIFGGTKREAQLHKLRNGVDLLISTPGRLLDFISSNNISLNRCTLVVLDEADRILNIDYQIREIFSKFQQAHQTLMWSATWPPSMQRLAADFLGKYIQVNVVPSELATNHNIKQIVKVCFECEKHKLLTEYLFSIYKETLGKILIFVATKQRVENLACFIRTLPMNCETIHGDHKQHRRDATMKLFRYGMCNILVATDVAGCGLDVDGITHVINYDFPCISDNYIHRIGRTGRATRTGTAITFFTTRDRRHASKLMSILMEAKQDVPRHLQQMAQNNGGPRYTHI